MEKVQEEENLERKNSSTIKVVRKGKEDQEEEQLLVKENQEKEKLKRN